MCNQLLPEIRHIQILSPAVQDNENLANLNPNDKCDTQSMLLITGLTTVCLVLIYYIFKYVKTIRKTRSDSRNSNRTTKIQVQHQFETKSIKFSKPEEAVRIIEGGENDNYIVLSSL